MSVRSIGRKLTLSYIFISLLTVVIMESLFFFAIYQYYITGMQQNLVNHADASVAMYNKYAPSGDIKQKQNFIFENMSTDENALVEVYDLKGNLLINNEGDDQSTIELTDDYNKAVKGKSDAWRGRIDTKEPVISVSVPIKDGDKVVGVLRYVSSTVLARSLMISNLFAVIAIGIGILVLAAIVGYIMSSRILIPIRDLIKVTREIALGNLDVKAKVFYKDEIGQLAQAVNRMTDEIALSDKSKNDFISSISHELRTPLTSINGWVETIEDSPDDIETTKLGVEIISRETKRLIRLVNDLLDFSKLQAHRIELETSSIWIDDFLEALYNQFLPRANQEKISLRLHLDNQDAMLIGDENRLRQVFINVIDNSFKFVAGRAKPEIVIQEHMLDDQIVITIEDNGPGMSSEVLMRVKEKFYKGNSKQSGTGLGLSIANEIISLHDGSFYIDSIRGVGTKVSVVLPVEKKSTLEEDIDRKNIIEDDGE